MYAKSIRPSAKREVQKEPTNQIPPMPRYYAKHEPSIDFSVDLETIKQIQIHKNSIRSVAESKNMSHATLARYVKKNNSNLFLFHLKKKTYF